MKAGGSPARQDRGAGNAVVPRNRHALLIEAGGEPIVVIGPIDIVLDVFFAAPHDLHRSVDLLGDRHGLRDAVNVQPPAEAAADQMIVHLDLVAAAGRSPAQPWLGRGSPPEFPPRSRSRPCAHERCSSSAPSRRARGTASHRWPRFFWRRPAEPWRHRRRCGRRRLASAKRFPSAARCRRSKLLRSGPSSQSMSSAARPCIAAHI